MTAGPLGALALGLCLGCTPKAATVAPEPPRAATEKPAEKSIGVATMAPDGTINLQLRAEDPATGSIGDGFFAYPPSHPQYEYIRKHVGPMKPGESKPVAPFPETKK